MLWALFCLVLALLPSQMGTNAAHAYSIQDTCLHQALAYLPNTKMQISTHLNASILSVRIKWTHAEILVNLLYCVTSQYDAQFIFVPNYTS